MQYRDPNIQTNSTLHNQHVIHINLVVYISKTLKSCKRIEQLLPLTSLITSFLAGCGGVAFLRDKLAAAGGVR